MGDLGFARPVRLSVESLERRDVPSASWFVEDFETAGESLPVAWEQYGTNGDSFQVTPTGVASGKGVTSAGSSSTEARAWLADEQPADLSASVSVYLDSLVPATLFVRGDNIDSDRPSYYGVSITRGLDLRLHRVEDGRSTLLGGMTSDEWVSNQWVRVTLDAEGDRLRVRVFRGDTAQYLAADGTWQGTPADALAVNDSAIAGSGHAGLARPTSVAGSASFDRFEVGPPRDAAALQPIHDQHFDRVGDETLPPGWSEWHADPDGEFAIDSARALVGPRALSNTAGVGSASRAWLKADLPADVTVSTSVYLDSLIPAQLFARGQNLDSDAPTYYAATVTRGMELQLQRTVDGEVTTVATMSTSGWQTEEWVHVTLETEGDRLRVAVYRPATAMWLDAEGHWGMSPAWAMEVTDSAIGRGGAVGVGRGGDYAGTLVFDNFNVASRPATASAVPVEEPVPTVTEDFNSAETGTPPEGWTHWANGPKGGFIVSGPSSVSDTRSLVGLGSDSFSARLWRDTGRQDVEVIASVYPDGTAPAELLLRGTGLDTTAASFYAASVGGDGTVSIYREASGERENLASVTPTDDASGLWYRARFRADGADLSVSLQRADTGEFLDEFGSWQSDETAAIHVRDTEVSGGAAGLNRPSGYTGRVFIDDLSVQAPTGAPPDSPITPPDTDPPAVPPTVPPPVPPPVVVPPPTGGELPDIVAQFDHIRIAQLAYTGTPIGALEQQLLRDAVDLVVPAPGYLEQIDEISPDAGQVIYTNFSNIYMELLTDWNAYADRAGVSREAAFYHVNQATPFEGSSGSSIPVYNFWSVKRTDENGVSVLTSAGRSSSGLVDFGQRGSTLAVGNIEKFREMNVRLAREASGGWYSVLEYVTAVDGAGNPTAWAPVPILADATKNLRQSGTVEFDPPRNWVPASIDGSDSFYFVRYRTILPGGAPSASRIHGRDYVNSGTLERGTIPAFDYAADRDGDGYLNETEYANRSPGHEARFEYESRAFFPAYGQNRFATDPNDPTYRAWAVDFARRTLDANPLADGFFVDNSPARLRIDPQTLHESVEGYAEAYASLLGQVNAGIGDRFLVANTAGAGDNGVLIAEQGVSYLEEFGLRPLASTWTQFEDFAERTAARAEALDGRGFAILDSYPQNGSATDPRTQMATLSQYYTVADPDSTMLMFFGGSEPSTSWSRHWVPAAAFDVGQPAEEMSEFAAGQDPSNPSLTYKVFQREYENALVLYKPLSYSQGVTGTLGYGTATVHNLDAQYRVLRADGSLGDVVTRVALRNGEGAVLVKV